MVVKRKLLPYCILQLACGISILALLGFSDAVVKGFASGRIFVAHVANVLISAVLGLLELYTVESFPDRYRWLTFFIVYIFNFDVPKSIVRMYCVGICGAFGRIGTLTAAGLTLTPYLNEVYGPGNAWYNFPIYKVQNVIDNLIVEYLFAKSPTRFWKNWKRIVNFTFA